VNLNAHGLTLQERSIAAQVLQRVAQEADSRAITHELELEFHEAVAIRKMAEWARNQASDVLGHGET